jgi:hypothetical protein
MTVKIADIVWENESDYGRRQTLVVVGRIQGQQVATLHHSRHHQDDGPDITGWKWYVHVSLYTPAQSPRVPKTREEAEQAVRTALTDHVTLLTTQENPPQPA